MVKWSWDPQGEEKSLVPVLRSQILFLPLAPCTPFSFSEYSCKRLWIIVPPPPVLPVCKFLTINFVITLYGVACFIFRSQIFFSVLEDIIQYLCLPTDGIKDMQERMKSTMGKVNIWINTRAYWLYKKTVSCVV